MFSPNQEKFEKRPWSPSKSSGDESEASLGPLLV